MSVFLSVAYVYMYTHVILYTWRCRIHTHNVCTRIMCMYLSTNISYSKYLVHTHMDRHNTHTRHTHTHTYTYVVNKYYTICVYVSGSADMCMYNNKTPIVYCTTTGDTQKEHDIRYSIFILRFIIETDIDVSE